MIRRCVVTETAARLSLQLEASAIPRDFEEAGGYRQSLERVRDKYTNYRTLLAALPDCPSDCPLLAPRLSGVGCSSDNFARDMLKAEANQLATAVYAAWQARQGRHRSAEPASHPRPAYP